MTWNLSVNGIDLTTYGFTINTTDGVFDGGVRTLIAVPVAGSAGIMVTGGIESPRVVELSGSLTSAAKTVAGRLANEDAFKDLVRGGLVRLTRDDGSTTVRTITGHVERLGLTTIGHPVAPTDLRVTLRLACLESYWQAVEPSSRVLGATRATLVLGTAPSTPIIRIMGSATNPVVTYRDAGGTAQRTITLTITLAATTDWIDLDMRTRKITKYLSGVVTNGYTTMSTTSNFPFAFDPQDGDFFTSAWPTLEVSAGTGIAYWNKAYL